MENGSFKLKAAELIRKYKGEKTLYRVAKRADATYSTIHRIADKEYADASTGTAFDLVYGLGFSIDEIKNMTVGEIFEFVPKSEK